MFKKIWSPELIEEHILSRYGHEPLNSHYYSTTYPKVYAAAERFFGSWKEAITACGLDYDEIRRYKVWDNARIISTIKKYAAEEVSLSSIDMQNHDKSLYMASVRRFGSWGKAVTAAGIDYKSIRKRRSLSDKEIKKQILALYRANEDLSYNAMRKNHQYLLAYGMKRLGNGSWAAARLACGILSNYRLTPEKRKES